MASPTQSPGIDDLKRLECFICREEEERVIAKHASQTLRKWVHPCACKLVAHEACLLSWISQSQLQKSDSGEDVQNALRCPQCKARYVIDSDNPLVLRIFDSISRLLSRGGKYVTLGTIVSVIMGSASGVYVLFTAYGEHALRRFFGNEAYQYLLGSDWVDWPWHAWLNVPLIPVYLLISRTRFFVSFSTWWCIFLAPQYNHISHDRPLDLSHLTTWPPHPVWLSILFPFAQGAYIPMREFLTRRLLGISKPPERRTRRYLWDLEAFQGRLEIGLRDDDAPPEGAGPNQNAVNPDAPAPLLDGQGQNREDEALNDNEAVIRVTPYSLGRIIGGSLILPTASSVMGTLLRKLATGFKLYTLQRFLGLKSHHPTIRLSPYGVPDTFGQLDPVYWRNTIGLGLYLVTVDCFSLFHIWLKHRELASRRIRNRSFAGMDVSDLDLISPPRAT